MMCPMCQGRGVIQDMEHIEEEIAIYDPASPDNVNADMRCWYQCTCGWLEECDKSCKEPLDFSGA